MTRARQKQAVCLPAVRGELFDAHKFVPQVMEQGAVGVISEQERPAEFQRSLAAGRKRSSRDGPGRGRSASLIRRAN